MYRNGDRNASANEICVNVGRKWAIQPLHIPMGISTGYCHVGNYGASHRMAYTIVGRDVNLAAAFTVCG